MAKHLNPRSCLCLPAVPALTHAVPPLLGVVHRLDDRALRPSVAVLDWKPIGELPRRHRVQLVLTAESDLDPRLLEQRPDLEGVRGSHSSILTTIKAWHPFGLAKSEVQYSHSHSFEQARNPNRQTLKSACKVFRPLLSLDNFASNFTSASHIELKAIPRSHHFTAKDLTKLNGTYLREEIWEFSITSS